MKTKSNFENLGEGLDIFELHKWEDPLLPFIFHTDSPIAGKHFINGNWHDSLEILQILEGKGELLYGSYRYSLTPGDIAVISSNELHHIKTDRVIKYHCLIVSVEFCRQNGFDVTKLRYSPIIKDSRLFEAYSRAAQDILDHRSGRSDIFSVTAIRSDILALLLLLNRDYSSPLEKKMDEGISSAIRAGLSYININFCSDISIDEIARHANVSKYHLMRQFKHYTGYTIVTYINILRCERAKSLLESGKYSVGEVARLCGFENLSYFSKTYAKYERELPSRHKMNNNAQ